MLYFFSFFTALAVSMVLIPPLMRMARNGVLLDQPDARKVHDSAMPRVGGIAIAAGALLPILMWVPLDRELMSLVVGLLVILVFGVLDDWREMSHLTKFAGQIIAVLLVVLYGGVTIDRMPFSGFEAMPEAVSIPLTIFALVGITNAINLADGLDGLAGGTSLMALGTIALLAYLVGGLDVVLVALAVMGGTVGFLRYNTYPARVFMGDSGSQFLGFALGVLVIIVTQKTHPTLSPAVAIMILGFPILDTFTVMGQRLSEGRSLFAPDKNHLHHRLLRLGFDHYEAVLLIYVVQGLLLISAYLLRYQSDGLLMSLYGLMCALILGAFYLAERNNWTVRYVTEMQPTRLVRWIAYLREVGWMYRVPVRLVDIAVGAFFLLAAIVPDQVPADFGLLSFGLIVALLSGHFIHRGKLVLIERAALYVTSAFAVYLTDMIPGWLTAYATEVAVFYWLVAGAIVIAIRFGGTETFGVSPLDVLVIFIALVVPNLPGTTLGQFGIEAAKLIVLFYGCELVAKDTGRHWSWLKLGALTYLFILGFRGI